ncbi:DMT family transporter [archaeon]|nr:DMT family transporter [archaeon]
MYAELVALVASITTALSSVMATRGMRDSNPDTANLVLTGIQTVVLSVLLVFDLPQLNYGAIFWYALAGVCGSFFARLLTMMSYKRIGVSAGSALIGTSPVVTTILAVLFLGEPLLLAVVLGAFCVVAGIAFINLKDGRLNLDWNLVYLPLGASFLYALSNIIRKMGTNLQPHAILGAQVSTLAGLMACGVYLAVKSGFRDLEINRDNVWWLAGAGAVNAFAWITVTMAINLGRVSVASSIIYSYPLFSLLLSRLLLRDEYYNHYMVIGSLFIVVGVAIVSLFG